MCPWTWRSPCLHQQSSALGQAGIWTVASPCGLGPGNKQPSFVLGQACTWTASSPCTLRPRNQQISSGQADTLIVGSPCALRPGDQEHSCVLVQVGASTVSSPHSLRHGSILPPTEDRALKNCTCPCFQAMSCPKQLSTTPIFPPEPWPPGSFQTRSPPSQLNTRLNTNERPA